jgi:hypothetical protein
VCILYRGFFLTCFDMCVGNLVICVLVFTVFYIVCIVFLYCFVLYICSYLSYLYCCTDYCHQVKGGTFSSKHSFLFDTSAPQWAKASSFTRFVDHTQQSTTVSSNPLDEWLAPRRHLYLTTHSNQNRPMPPTWFEPTISAGERPLVPALWNISDP